MGIKLRKLLTEGKVSFKDAVRMAQAQDPHDVSKLGFTDKKGNRFLGVSQFK